MIILLSISWNIFEIVFLMLLFDSFGKSSCKGHQGWLVEPHGIGLFFNQSFTILSGIVAMNFNFFALNQKFQFLSLLLAAYNEDS